jgi:prophage regulatory protein
MQSESTTSRYNRAPAQTLQALHIPEALLKIKTVEAVTGLSESTIRRRAHEGTFPQPVKDGARCTRWVAGQVSNWLRAKAAA